MIDITKLAHSCTLARPYVHNFVVDVRGIHIRVNVFYLEATRRFVQQFQANKRKHRSCTLLNILLGEYMVICRIIYPRAIDLESVSMYVLCTIYLQK